MEDSVGFKWIKRDMRKPFDVVMTVYEMCLFYTNELLKQSKGKYEIEGGMWEAITSAEWTQEYVSLA